MRPGEYGWPPAFDHLTEWTCSEGHGCDEGWFEFPADDFVLYPKSGGAATAQRCPCVVKNIQERKRGKRRNGSSGDW